MIKGGGGQMWPGPRDPGNIARSPPHATVPALLLEPAGEGIGGKDLEGAVVDARYPQTGGRGVVRLGGDVVGYPTLAESAPVLPDALNIIDHTAVGDCPETFHVCIPL